MKKNTNDSTLTWAGLPVDTTPVAILLSHTFPHLLGPDTEPWDARTRGQDLGGIAKTYFENGNQDGYWNATTLYSAIVAHQGSDKMSPEAQQAFINGYSEGNSPK